MTSSLYLWLQLWGHKDPALCMAEVHHVALIGDQSQALTCWSKEAWLMLVNWVQENWDKNWHGLEFLCVGNCIFFC